MFKLEDFFLIFEDVGRTKPVTFIQFSPLSAEESETKKVYLFNRSGFLIRGIRLAVDTGNERIVRVNPLTIPQILIGGFAEVEVTWTCTKDQEEPLRAKLFISGSFIKPASLP